MKEALIYRRQAANLTQAQVAAILQIDRTTVTKWETGESAPRASMMPRLAALYKCSIGELYSAPRTAKTAPTA